MTQKKPSSESSIVSIDSLDLIELPQIDQGDYVQYEYDRFFEDVGVEVTHRGAGYVEKFEMFRPRPYLVRTSSNKHEWLTRDEIRLITSQEKLKPDGK